MNPALNTSFLAELVRGETLFGGRVRWDHAGTRTLMFSSRGLPAQCRVGLGSREGQVKVAVIMNPTLDPIIQVLGTHPEAFSPSCAIAIATEIHHDEFAGLKLVSSNLDRMQGGGVLSLEFTVPARSTQLMPSVKRVLGENGTGLRGLSRSEAGPFILMVFCAIVLIWGFRLAKKRSTHVQ